MEYATADLHLSHQNIIKYSGRPFVDANAMNEYLVDTWNATEALEEQARTDHFQSERVRQVWFAIKPLEDG